MIFLFVLLCLQAQTFAGFAQYSATDDSKLEAALPAEEWGAKIVDSELQTGSQIEVSSSEDLGGFTVQSAGLKDTILFNVKIGQGISPAKEVISKIATYLKKHVHQEFQLTVYQRSELPKKSQTDIQQVVQLLQNQLTRESPQSIIIVPEYVLLDDTSELPYWQSSFSAVMALSYFKENS